VRLAHYTDTLQWHQWITLPSGS